MKLDEKVVEILSHVLKVPQGEFSMESSPYTVESWDSLNQIKLIMALEEEYGVRFSDSQIQNITDVKSILQALR